MLEILELYWKNNFFIGIVLLELVLCISFEKKKNSILKWIFFALLSFAVSSAFLSVWTWEEQRITVSNILLNIPGKVVICILTILQMYVCFEISLWNAVFILTVSIIIQKAQFGIYKILEVIFIGPVTFTTPGIKSVELALGVLIVTALILRCVIRGNRKLSVSVEGKNKNVILLSLMLMILSDVSNIYLFTSDPYANFGNTMICMRLYAIMFDCTTLYMLYNLISRKNLEMERMMHEMMERQRVSQYRFSKELFETINIKSHDLKKQMKYLKNEDVDQEEFLSEIKDTLESFDMTVHTNNSALDTILSEKGSVCRQQQIQFSYIASGEHMDFMKELDIYTLFANLMDNAIEASVKVPMEKRYIQIIIKTQGELLSIHIENYFWGEIQRKNGEIVTIKENKNYHGFGVKSVRQIVEKYQGSITLNTNDQIFSVNMLIPIPEQ